MTKELTKKELYKEALRLACPAMLESFFVAFAGLIDSYMVSTLGSNSVAAVGLTTQPKFMGLAFFFAINVAISALVARRYGQKEKKDANGIFVTALSVILVMAVIISIVCVIFAPSFMKWCGSTPETHDDAVLYFRIVMGGMIFNCVQMGINSALRGSGNTIITMRTNITSNTINVIFNYLLIGGHLGFPALGIKGAASATVLGTVVACIMSIMSVCKEKEFVSIPYTLRNKIKPTLDSLKSIIKLGYSVFFEQILMRIGFTLTAVMAANQGNGAMAAHQVAMNLMGLTFSFGDGLQAAAVALIGRSLGQGLPELAKKFGMACRRIGMCIALILTMVYFFGGRMLFSLFFKEKDIVEIGVKITYVIIFVVVFQISQVIYMGCLRGAGDTAYTAFASTVSVSIIRTIGSYVFGYMLNMGITGIWFGVLADQVSRYIFASIRFKQGKWVKIKI